jgi:hypothetical protein
VLELTRTGAIPTGTHFGTDSRLRVRPLWSGG